LRFRREEPGLFREGSYRPLKVVGGGSDHIIAFARMHDAGAVVALCPRWMSGAMSGDLHLRPGVLSGTCVDLPAGHTWRNLLVAGRVCTDGTALRVRDAFCDLPVAVLHGRKA